MNSGWISKKHPCFQETALVGIRDSPFNFPNQNHDVVIFETSEKPFHMFIKKHNETWNLYLYLFWPSQVLATSCKLVRRWPWLGKEAHGWLKCCRRIPGDLVVWFLTWIWICIAAICWKLDWKWLRWRLSICLGVFCPSHEGFIGVGPNFLQVNFWQKTWMEQKIRRREIRERVRTEKQMTFIFVGKPSRWPLNTVKIVKIMVAC